jgi:dienelactone hydrolase
MKSKIGLALPLLLLTHAAFAGVVGRDIEYRAGDTMLKGWLAQDTAIKGQRAGILVVPEWWGANDYARQRARMLAEHGYVALVVDMYGNGKTVDNPKEAGELSGEIGKHPDVALARFRAAEAVLMSQPEVKRGALGAYGYCFGGGVILNMARAGEPLKAIASFHGVLATEMKIKPGAVKTRMRIFTGEDDPVVPMAQVAAFKAEMDAAHVDYKVVTYPGAKHAFSNRAADSYAAQYQGLPIKYDATADADSWAQSLAFMKSVFK